MKKFILFTLLSLSATQFIFAQKTFNVSSGSWATAGNWSPAGVPSITDDVIIPGGATVTISATANCKTLLMKGNSTAATVTISGTNVLNVANRVTYENVTANKSNIINVNAGTLNCGSLLMNNNGNNTLRQSIMNITTGTLNSAGDITMNGQNEENQISITGAGKLSFANNFNINNGRFNPGTSGTVDYAYAGNQNIINPSAFYINQYYPNLMISGSGTKSMITTMTIANALTLNAGTFSITYNSIVVNGTTTVASGATLLDDNGGGTNAFNAVINDGTVTISAYNTTTFGGDITNNGTINNTGSGSTWTLSGTLINNGTFYTNGYNTIEFRNGITNNGSFTAGTGPISFTTNNQVIAGNAATVFTNATIAASKTVTNNNSDTVYFNGELLGSDGNSTWINGANSTLYVTRQPMATGILTASATNNRVICNFSYYNTFKPTTYFHLEKWGNQTAVFNGTYAINGDFITSPSASGDIITYNAFNVAGNFDLNGSSRLTFSNSVFITIAGNLSGTGSIEFYTYNNAGINLAGNFSNTGSFTPGNSLINYNGTGTQQVKAASYANLTLSGSGTKTLLGNASIATNCTFNLNSDVIFNADTYPVTPNGTGTTFNINGTFQTSNPNGFTGAANSAITNANNPTVNVGNASTIIYQANSDQVITGRTDYNNLTILNSGIKTMSGPVTVTGTFSQSTGTLKVGNNLLSLNGPVTMTGIIAGGTNTELNLAGSGALISMNVAQTSTEDKTFKNITLNRASGLSVEQALELTGTLKLTAGSVASNGNLTLVSNASGTARVDEISCPTCSITGNVTVQRFIPGGAGKRRWRLLGSSVSASGTIAVTQIIDNILVTGTGGSANGFDNSPNNNHSFKTYTESVAGASANGWTYPANVNSTVANGMGMCVFVRGDRNTIDPFNTSGTPNDATIDYTGALNQKDFTTTLSYTNTGSTADGFNLVANPYPSAIDWKAASGWTKTNVQNKVWIYNPATGSYGTYDATLDVGTNSCTRYIASGQGFFVKTTGASPSLGFKESVKVTNTPSNFFRSAAINNLVRLTLVKDSLNTDESIIYLNPDAQREDTDEFDANKFFNDDMNMYTKSSNGTNLAINGFPVPYETDTIRISLFSYQGSDVWSGDYRFDFSGINTLDDSLDLYLLDLYDSVKTDMRAFSEYHFSITDAASMGNNRFRLVIRNNSLRTSVPATAANSDNNLFNVYPNPFKEELKITFAEAISNERVQVTLKDALGRTIYDAGEVSANGTFSIQPGNDLAKGLYIIQIRGNNIFSQKKLIRY